MVSSLFRRMAARDPHEPHRVATPLELLFDLCFVVAVAQAAARLHHGIAEGHAAHAVISYGMVFFAVWWAWMNFTWFASAYDVDDVLYRVTAQVQIAGVLVLAAGVPRAFDRGDFTVVTAGYATMRVGLVAQWLRAARVDGERRRTALRFALGVVLCQVGWIGILFAPAGWWRAGWAVLVLAEMLVPIWAESAGKTTWHPHHIAERYGLMTLIVLGESVLAATVAIQSAIDAGALSPRLAAIVAGGLLTVFSMWWIYFDQPAARFLTSNRRGFIWGYGHLFVFGSAAAVGAGLAVAVDLATGRVHLPVWAHGAAVAAPVAVFLLCVWFLHVRPLRRGPRLTAAYLVAAPLVLATSPFWWSTLAVGSILGALVALTIASPHHDRPAPQTRAIADE